MPKAGYAHNPKSTTDYTDDTDGEVNVTNPNPFHISAIRAIRGKILVIYRTKQHLSR